MAGKYGDKNNDNTKVQGVDSSGNPQEITAVVNSDGSNSLQVTGTRDDDEKLDFRELVILLKHMIKQQQITNFYLACMSDLELDEGDEQQ